MAARRPAHPGPGSARRHQRGVSLLIALVMLGIIALGSVALVRQVLSSDQVANHARLRAEAAESAQLALQFCTRQVSAEHPRLPLPPPPAAAASGAGAASEPAWMDAARWRMAGAGAGAGAGAYTLRPGLDFEGRGPAVPPQCLLERAPWPGVWWVTARGFSSDWQADPATGRTRQGSTVWLQAELLAPEPARRPVARHWQQLLTPPL